jgi:hypothetical protein
MYSKNKFGKCNFQWFFLYFFFKNSYVWLAIEKLLF